MCYTVRSTAWMATTCSHTKRSLVEGLLALPTGAQLSGLASSSHGSEGQPHVRALRGVSQAAHAHQHWLDPKIYVHTTFVPSK